MLRRFLSFIMPILLLSLNSNYANAVPIPEAIEPIYVQDFASTISIEKRDELVELGNYLEEHAEIQLALLTVPSLNNVNIENYMIQAFSQYDLGDNGVLILLTTEDRKLMIKVGDGLDEELPDGMIGQLIDQFALPFLEQNDTEMALTNTYKQLFNEIARVHHLKKKVKTTSYTYGSFSWITILAFLIGILGFLYIDKRFTGGRLMHFLRKGLSHLLKFVQSLLQLQRNRNYMRNIRK